MRSIRRSLLLPALLALAGGCREPADGEATLVGQPTESDTLYGVPAAANLRVVPVEVEVPGLPAGLDGVRVAALSDFQLGLWDDNAAVAEAAVRKAVSLRPELIVLLGDYVARGDNLDQLRRVLAPLRGQRVFAVLGDRDVRTPTPGQTEPDSAAIRLVQALQASGVVVLRNERGILARGADTAYVAGVDPYVAVWPEWRQAETFAAIPRSGSTPLLLAHTPATVLAAPDSTYPLVVAGNTFCGRVEVPGTPRLSWVNSQQFPSGRVRGTDRLYRIEGNGLFITCGVGYSFVPVRLGAPPEVALITLRTPAGTAPPAARPDTASASVDSLLRVYQVQPDTTRADTTGEQGTGA